MIYKKRGQISTEYVIIVSFVIFLVLSTLGIAFFYSSEIRDAIKFNQIDSFSQKVISLAESVYYSGAPARTSTTAYLPEGINSIQISGREITFNISSSSGENILTFTSNVNLTGSISKTPGMKKIYINAAETHVTVNA